MLTLILSEHTAFSQPDNLNACSHLVINGDRFMGKMENPKNSVIKWMGHKGRLRSRISSTFLISGTVLPQAVTSDRPSRTQAIFNTSLIAFSVPIIWKISLVNMKRIASGMLHHVQRLLCSYIRQLTEQLCVHPQIS